MKNYIHLLVHILLLSTFTESILASPQFQDTIATTLDTFEIQGNRVNRVLTSTTVEHRISNNDLNKLGIVNISDALRRMPGVNLHDYGGAGSLKTISVRGLGTQHTGVSYDGVPLCDVQSGQIDLSRYSIDNISDISLIIGDNDDIFVPARLAASAASLSIGSWSPDVLDHRKLYLTAQIKGGSFGYVSPYLCVGASNGRNMALLMTGEYTHSDNDYPYSIQNGNITVHSKRKNSAMDSGHGELNFKWQHHPGTWVSAKFYGYGSYQHLPGPAILYNDAGNETLRDVNLFGQVNFRSKLSSIFSINTLAKFNWSRTNYKDRNGKYPGGLLDNLYKQREAYATASMLCLPLDGLALSYALDYFYNDLRSNLKSNNSPHRNSILQSLNVKYKINCLTLTARALLSIYMDSPGKGQSNINHTRVSPSMGLSVKPLGNQDFHIRCNYKNIFRMPSFNELYFDHYGSLKLSPEITDQFNIGITYGASGQNWLSSLNVTVDSYFNIVKNKIVAVPYNMFVWTMTNMGKVHAYGIDVTLDARFQIYNRQSLILTGNYSWQRAISRTSPDKLDWNKQLPYTPVNSGTFSTTWENPWVSIGGHASGCSERYATKENIASTRLPGYVDIGFTAYHVFKFRGHELELRADLINAFNTQYVIVARYPMPGRSYQGSIKFSF